MTHRARAAVMRGARYKSRDNTYDMQSAYSSDIPSGASKSCSRHSRGCS